jgi:hypothetical protein
MFQSFHKLRTILEIEDLLMGQKQDNENILVKKGNQVHVTLLFLVAAYAVVYALLNLIQGYYMQSLLNFFSFLMVLVSYYLNAIGKILASKIFNLLQLIVLIGAMFFFSTSTYGSHSGDSILVFFIPIIVGTLIVFQGPEKKYGNYLALFTLVVLAFLMSFDFHYSQEKPTEMQEGVSLELVLNIVGAALGTFLEVSFIISLSNKLNEKLHKANKELDNFVYSVSHDLRSPLASVKGILMLAMEQKEYNQSMENYLSLASKQLENLDEIIREILAYSRNSRTALVKEKVDLQTMVTTIFSDLQFLPESNFEFRWGALQVTNAMADKSRLNTVLRNVIGNAVKYRNKNAVPPFVEVSLLKTSNTVQIKICDNGEGIEPDVQTKIFEMFYRNSNAAEGTGLGLYICREMMESMGGNISLKSKRGEGSAFVVELPV